MDSMYKFWILDGTIVFNKYMYVQELRSTSIIFRSVAFVDIKKEQVFCRSVCP